MADLVEPRLYSCRNCRNHVSLHDDMISKDFHMFSPSPGERMSPVASHLLHKASFASFFRGNENKHNQTRCKRSNQKRILGCKFPLFESFRIRGIEVSLMFVRFNILKETTISIGSLSLYFNKLLRVCQ
ncbi:uncharacterized protein LOC103951624 [Pyrus x bretschneideri]|uniref:uncharacterized protein LOC103951624 n=1 Tax=Pyrus x bretschneideri TaxID=225117 RepID=UPI002030C8C2|nr:uncharacterized protein LOC103951624 [Pyrus x bretschneideri]